MLFALPNGPDKQPGAVGNWLGERALDRMGEKNFRLVFRTILTLLGLRLIWVAIADWSGVP